MNDYWENILGSTCVVLHDSRRSTNWLFVSSTLRRYWIVSFGLYIRIDIFCYFKWKSNLQKLPQHTSFLVAKFYENNYYLNCVREHMASEVQIRSRHSWREFPETKEPLVRQAHRGTNHALHGSYVADWQDIYVRKSRTKSAFRLRLPYWEEGVNNRTIQFSALSWEIPLESTSTRTHYWRISNIECSQACLQ